MLEISAALHDFLEGNITLIDTLQMDELYEKMNRFSMPTGSLTDVLLSIDVDPLLYFSGNVIPNNYAIDSKLLEKVVIPHQYTATGDFSFANCSNLRSVELPESLKKIARSSFGGSSLEAITIPDGVESVGWAAFYKCEQLKSIIIPDSVTYLGGDAFGRCHNLKTAKIGKGVKRLFNSTFYDCYNIETIFLPAGITHIDDGALAHGNEQKVDIFYSGTKEQWKAIVRGRRWKTGGSRTIVHCIDGNL